MAKYFPFSQKTATIRPPTVAVIPLMFGDVAHFGNGNKLGHDGV